MKTNDHNFRSYLRLEFDRRLKGNGNYSLRAFARDLKTNAGSLSVILSGKRPLTQKAILHFSQHLGLGPLKVKEFLGQPPSAFQLVEEEIFGVLSEWYYDAILELTRTKNFRSDERWIARRLAISVHEVRIALDRLLRLGWIKKSQGRYVLQKVDSDVELGAFSTLALNHLQLQALEISKKNLIATPLESRYHATMTLAIPKEKIIEAKTRLREFRREFCVELQKNSNLSEVYQLQIGFYPLTELQTKSEGEKT